MGVSDPEVRKKLSEPRWLQYKHESEKQSWPWWKRLIHRFQRCPTWQTGESERAIKYRQREMSAGGSFGVRMEGLNRLLGRVVNLK
jgi:hypothetical protein